MSYTAYYLLFTPLLYSLIYSIKMRCSQGQCQSKATIVMHARKDNRLHICVSNGTCKEEDYLTTEHESQVTSREAVAHELSRNIGPTEALENVKEVTMDPFLTKEGVQTLAGRKRRKEIVPDCWPRDTMLCLSLLKDVQKDEISSEEAVPGYIQVSYLMLLILLEQPPRI